MNNTLNQSVINVINEFLGASCADTLVEFCMEEAGDDWQEVAAAVSKELNTVIDTLQTQ